MGIFFYDELLAVKERKYHGDDNGGGIVESMK
jgi:hypothetical protein